MVDFQEILDYALRSQLAYAITQPGWSITEKIGWRTASNVRLEIEDVPGAEVNTLVELQDDDQVQWIAVRGSSNLENWILNFQYIQHLVEERYDGNETHIHFHCGFYKAAQAVYQAILPHLTRSYKTRITGHSLGGAIAAILMVLMDNQGYQIEKCITFGQPKITNKKGAEQLQPLPFLRLINEEDIVPLLPPSTLVTLLQGGYEHFGLEIRLQSGDYTYSQDPTAQGNHADSFWANLVQAVTEKDASHSTDNIKDHFIQHYLLNILSNMEAIDPNLEQLLSR